MSDKIKSKKGHSNLMKLSKETESTHVFTSFSFSYLSRARILADTVKKNNPNIIFWAFIADDPPPQTDIESMLSYFDYVIYAKDMFPGIWKSWIFKHNVVEACTAIKGHALAKVFEYGARKVIYLDPDTAVINCIDAIIENLDNYSIILTPHITAPNLNEESFAAHELACLKLGVYNLGFIAIRNDQTGRSFAKWWSNLLVKKCYDAPEIGIFTDQKYVDLVPSLFPRVFIERSPGYNVASWNISNRLVKFGANGQLMSNGEPLLFYHFTKINSAGDVSLENYAGDNSDLYELWHWYKRRLSTEIASIIPKNYWAYATYSDGSPIPQDARIFYRTSTEAQALFPNPFESLGVSYKNYYSSVCK